MILTAAAPAGLELALRLRHLAELLGVDGGAQLPCLGQRDLLLAAAPPVLVRHLLLLEVSKFMNTPQPHISGSIF